MMITGARPVAVYSLSKQEERRYPREEAVQAMFTNAK